MDGLLYIIQKLGRTLEMLEAENAKLYDEIEHLRAELGQLKDAKEPPLVMQGEPPAVAAPTDAPSSPKPRPATRKVGK